MHPTEGLRVKVKFYFSLPYIVKHKFNKWIKSLQRHWSIQGVLATIQPSKDQIICSPMMCQELHLSVCEVYIKREKIHFLTHHLDHEVDYLYHYSKTFVLIFRTFAVLDYGFPPFKRTIQPMIERTHICGI